MDKNGTYLPINSKMLIATVIPDDWGGSEVLWAHAVPLLQEEGWRMTVLKTKVDLDHPSINKLRTTGVSFATWMHRRPLWKRVIRKFASIYHNNRSNDNYLPGFARSANYYSLYRRIKAVNPKVVLINQGINFDGMDVAYACKSLQIPYFLICHKAVEHFWPWPADRQQIAALFDSAMATFFVSKHTQRVTEQQIGKIIPRGHLIYNPILIDKLIPFPTLPPDQVRWCCIGRLQLVDKGQDILLNVLSQPKWKERPLYIDILGSGPDRTSLEELARFLGVTKVKFLGYSDQIQSVWSTYHVLISPSRCEGLPLTIMEAMMAGRPVITTQAGGSAEVIQEGVTGFVAACNEASLDEAMERAWQSREHWQTMGMEAHQWIVANIPQQPEQAFIQLLNQYLCKLPH
jgi:glycosyltransferase involved in cell wall biosynthesis